MWKKTLSFTTSLAISSAAVFTGTSPLFSDSLPALDCVRQIREARIVGAEDPSRELDGLRSAAEACPDEIAPVLALLNAHHFHPLKEEEHRALEEMLSKRIIDQERPLPPSLLRQMLWGLHLDEKHYLQVTEVLEQRLANTSLSQEDRHELLLLLKDLWQRLGNQDSLLATIERLHELSPDEKSTWLLIGQYRSMERWSEIADLLTPIVSAGSRELRQLLVDALSHTDRTAELAREMKLLISPDPTGDTTVPTPQSRQALIERVAWNLHDAGRDDLAEKYFRRLLAINPEASEWRNIVLHLYGSEEERLAHSDTLERQWETEEDPQRLFDEGTQRLTAGDAEGAIELLERAAPYFPEMEALWYNLGMAAWKVKRWETSATSYDKAAQLNPARIDAFFFGGLAWANLKRCEDAMAPLLRTVEMDPSRALAHYHLSTCYARQGDQEAAQKHRTLYEANRD